ncbi:MULTISPECIES: hypothetical protein [Streptomyces]|jgi:hypothetical protein|uniref:Uncharacterized protein n=1 Tax=Streptomyces doudnae TaxID=3075536 RepID=A0ABD5F1J8_9ACTN|nr:MULTISPECIES: hypothetical protein [unclassified Streptomyces]MDT0440385.1 hypothetical protein [Streptomyces sp. DSM 41981]MYQ62167.1 hypothetical protein [Streptomyces sp. SID4950]SCD31875.1 hypothetical protein GA0115242_102825 [Streptomyces sp. SolWspMP-5a-2]
MTRTPLRAELLFAQDVSARDEQHMVALMAELGAPAAQVRRSVGHRGPEELHWLVLASLPLQAFLSGIGAEAVKDAYRGLANLVGRLTRRSASPGATPRPVVLQDERSGVRVVLEGDLPPEAYRELALLDLSRFALGPVHWDRALGRWRSELDEAAG